MLLSPLFLMPFSSFGGQVFQELTCKNYLKSIKMQILIKFGRHGTGSRFLTSPSDTDVKALGTAP